MKKNFQQPKNVACLCLQGSHYDEVFTTELKAAMPTSIASLNYTYNSVSNELLGVFYSDVTYKVSAFEFLLNVT